MSTLPTETVLPDFWGVLQKIARKSYTRGDLIYMKGEETTCLHVVLSGRVKIIDYSADGRETILDILHRGQFFDLKNLCGQRQSDHFAVAMDRETKVGCLPLHQLDELLDEQPNLRQLLTCQLTQKLEKQEQRLQTYAFLNSRQRVVAFFLQLIRERGQRVGLEWVIRESYTHLEIANYTATARQTVSTTIGRLRAKNLINYNRRYIVIRDLDALKAMVE